MRRPQEIAADRGQSQVIGAILIFGFVIAGLGLYQVTVVPQQTSEIELRHSEIVKDDFSDVHSAITNAGTTNDLRTTSVKLGTRYPARALTLNPAPAQGRLATERFGSGISFPNVAFTTAGVCDTSGNPQNLTYNPNYNELSNAGTHGYETSVTYHESDGKIIDSKQVLVQGTTIRLLPLTEGTVSTTAIDRESLEFEGGKTGGTTVSAPLEIVLPTELTEDQWRTVLSDANKVDSISKPTSDTVKITLVSDQYTLRCTPIGEGKAPTNNPPITPGGGGSGSTNPAINPAGPGSVAYETAAMADDDGDGTENGVIVTFRNADTQTRTIEEARVAFYTADGQGGGGGTPGQKVDIVQDGTQPFEDVGGPYISRANVAIAPGSTETVQVDFYCNDPSTPEYTVGQGDYFVLSLKFQNGETSNYFINPPAGSTPGNNPC